MAFLVRCGLPLMVFAMLASPRAESQERKLRDLKWSHAFDLAARKLGEANFAKNTKRYGVEAFLDDNTGLGLYISQTGSMAVAPHFKGLTFPITPSKGPEHLTGLDLPTRKAGEKDFKKETRAHSLEVFRDPNTDDWLLITEKGNLAATTGKLFPGASNKSPKWIHSVDLAVRKGGVKEWHGATKVGIEIYRDGNTGNLVYITEAGHVAVIPETKEITISKAKAPDWLHGLDLKCRRFDEKAFTNETKKFGVEAYHDVSTGNLIFISETGSIAVAPAPAAIKAPTIGVKEPQWTHGLNVKARERGEVEFSEKTRSFGAEVFLDPNLDAVIYINELGYIAVPSAK